jgi:hypothetical protein
MSALPSWRRAYGALKDTTTVSLANLNSDFKVPAQFPHHFPVLSWFDSPDFPTGRGDEEFSCGHALWICGLYSNEINFGLSFTLRIWMWRS